MSRITWRSVPILSTQNSESVSFGNDTKTTTYTTYTTYNMGDVVTHSPRVSLAKVVLVPDIGLALRTIKSILIKSLYMNILTIILFILIGNIVLHTTGLEIPIKNLIYFNFMEGNFYLIMMPYTLIYLTAYYYAKYLKHVYIKRVKKACYADRGFGMFKFDEDNFDAKYKIVKESQWDQFASRLT